MYGLGVKVSGRARIEGSYIGADLVVGCNDALRVHGVNGVGIWARERERGEREGRERERGRETRGSTRPPPPTPPHTLGCVGGG